MVLQPVHCTEVIGAIALEESPCFAAWTVKDDGEELRWWFFNQYTVPR